MEQSIRSVLDSARSLLRGGAGSGGDRPCRLDAELLLAHVLGRDRLWLAIHVHEIIEDAAAERFRCLVEQRARGVPVSQLVGRKEFFGRDFFVTKDTLTPRPETELLVELALHHGPKGKAVFADLGTGTGCIGLTLALERREWRGLLLEKSPAALAICQKNRAHHGADNVLVLQGDMTSPPLAGHSLDVVCANPPYIALDDRDVAPDVREHEPSMALFAEQGGLAALFACIEAAAHALKPGGIVLLEHGKDQGPAVRSALAAKNFSRIATKKDLAGLDRVSLAHV